MTPLIVVGTCTLTVTLEYFDESMSQWRDHSNIANTFVQSFIAVDTGVFTVFTSDTATYDPDDGPFSEYNMRITFTDNKSDETLNTVTDTFKLILKNRCTINELTLTGDLPNVLYYIADPQTSAITLPFSVTEASCTITHTLQLFDTTTQEWTAWSAVTHPYV